MASKFITQQEVIDIAFTREIRPEYVPESKIDIAEMQFVQPVLGEKLYQALNVDNTQLSAEQVVAKVHIKKALAYYVKYEILPDLGLQASNRGINLRDTEMNTPASDRQRGELRETALNNGHTLIGRATQYIEENPQHFPEYTRSGNVKNRIQKRGGLIL